jgi:hypothetical protein
LDDIDIQELISTMENAWNPTENLATKFEHDDKIKQHLEKGSVFLLIRIVALLSSRPLSNAQAPSTQPSENGKQNPRVTKLCQLPPIHRETVLQNYHTQTHCSGYRLWHCKSRGHRHTFHQ